jgi:biopolymer transport protein ExbB
MNFSVYWQHADAVSKTLYFILLAMSIATWTIFILRLMGTRQLKQQAYAQLAQALTSLKSKLQPLTFEQRKAVAEQALFVKFLLKSLKRKKVYLYWVQLLRLHHSLVCLVQSGESSMRLLLSVRAVKQV